MSKHKMVNGKLFQMVKGITERTTPFLVPIRATTRRASAITIPAPHTMGTAPGTAFATARSSMIGW